MSAQARTRTALRYAVLYNMKDLAASSRLIVQSMQLFQEVRKLSDYVHHRMLRAPAANATGARCRSRPPSLGRRLRHVVS